MRRAWAAVRVELVGDDGVAIGRDDLDRRRAAFGFGESRLDGPRGVDVAAHAEQLLTAGHPCPAGR
jgi:hypothetical protein